MPCQLQQQFLARMLSLHTKEQMKKRKLNSKNPKLQPTVVVSKDKEVRKLINNKDGVKIYAIFKS